MISNKTITVITTIMLAFDMMFYSLMIISTRIFDTMFMKDGIQEIINTKNNRYLTGGTIDAKYKNNYLTIIIKF